MRKLLLPFIFVTALLLAACNSSEEPNDPMHWSFVNSSPDGIKCDSTLTGEVPQIYLTVNGRGCEITLSCTNYSTVVVNNATSYDLKWGTVTSDGSRVKCLFPENTTGGEQKYELIRLTAHSKGGSVESYLHVTRTFGDMNPDDEE